MIINHNKIDWPALSQQKAMLINLGNEMSFAGRQEVALYLDGVVALLDHLQDEAAKLLGEEAVYGPPEAGDGT